MKGGYDMSIIDISYKDEKSAALSNLFPYQFLIDDVKCFSMEGFLRSLCVSDKTRQGRLQKRELCSLSGVNAYRIKYYLPDWRKHQKVFWNRQEIFRESEEYNKMLERAYDALFQNNLFKLVLSNVPEDAILIHSIGIKDKTETLLTEEEYIFQLDRLRKLLLLESK
jgi:hypothetical protein